MALSAPRSIREFQQQFPDERACLEYLCKIRWPDGFRCASCGASAHYFYPDRRTLVCTECRTHVRVTAGSIMHRSKLPLSTWFYGAFLVSTLTPGLSAVQFQRQLGLSRYETAFHVLHKLRSAMVAPGREPLHGVVELDETYVGGVHKGGARGRSTEKKTLVVGAVEVRRERKRRFVAGRVRLRAVPDAGAATLDEFLSDHVAPGTVVLTDGHQGYRNLTTTGYRHRTKAGTDLPLIHREFANLKTWLRGTHHDRVERRHLQAYLNEFCFRHNRRFWPFAAFLRLLTLAIDCSPPTYRDLYSSHEFDRTVHRG